MKREQNFNNQKEGKNRTLGGRSERKKKKVPNIAASGEGESYQWYRLGCSCTC